MPSECPNCGMVQPEHADWCPTGKSSEPVPKPTTESVFAPIAAESSALYGVKGWLKFFVVVNLYIAPVVYVLNFVVTLIGFSILAEDYPAIVLVGLIELGVSGFLVVKWILIARRLRDIQPGVVQEAKTWLKIALGWVILSVPLAFMSGMDAEDLLPDAIKGVVLGLIGFAIWYSYFNVSKRVKTTYPDWHE